MKLSYSKPFHNTINYASTANIEEVMKFYNLGDKTFETDFNYLLHQFTSMEFTEVLNNGDSLTYKKRIDVQ